MVWYNFKLTIKKMSIVPKETIEVIAQSIGINNLSPDAALALAPDVEYRMREIMQEAIKCMRHSRRTLLTTDDVDGAFSLRNVEPVYGFASGDPLRFKRVVGHKDLFYLDDKDVDLKDVIEAPLPKAPLDTSIMCHWLAVDGIQPAVPENASVEAIPVPVARRSANKDDILPVEVRLPVRHVLSRELQIYYDKVTELTMHNSDSLLFKEALVSIATDTGIHPLVPYFTCFIADEVSRGLGDSRLLFALMSLIRSLLKNRHIQIERYLHQLMPSVVTCLVAKRLGNRFADNHWELRDFAAKLVSSICKRFGNSFSNLQPRLTRTFMNAFLDPKRSITQHYGAIQGLAALGSNVVCLLIVPNLESYMRLLEPEMLLETQKNEMKRHEAWTVYGALLRAAGHCIYDRLKMFPILPSRPAAAVWRNKEKVAAVMPGKRKASAENVEVQPPLKHVATDGPMDVVTNSSQSDVEMGGSVATVSAKSLDASLASPRSKTVSASSSHGNDANKGNSRSLKMTSVLNQVWKDELKSGKVLVSLFDMFGESILPFVPAPEMYLFL